MEPIFRSIRIFMYTCIGQYFSTLLSSVIHRIDFKASIYYYSTQNNNVLYKIQQIQGTSYSVLQKHFNMKSISGI
jgi:hypothetical protein